MHTLVVVLCFPDILLVLWHREFSGELPSYYIGGSTGMRIRGAVEGAISGISAMVDVCFAKFSMVEAWEYNLLEVKKHKVSTKSHILPKYTSFSTAFLVS